MQTEKKIKSLVFDNNGVLTSTEEEAYILLSQLANVERTEMEDAWKELAKDVDEGKTPVNKFLKNLAEHFNLQKDISKVREIYYKQYVRDDNMHEVVKKLSKKYKVALLSNFGDAFTRFDKQWKSEETFGENVFVSAFLKMRKPKKEAFQFVLNKLEVDPEESIFIDDRLENVESAKKVGMRGIVFENAQDFILDLLLLEKRESYGK